MRKEIKYALIFIGGLAVGIGYCGGSVLAYAVKDGDIRDAIKTKVTRKIDKCIYGNGARGFSNKSVYFNSMNTANKVLNDMRDMLYEHGYVSEADYYDLACIKSYTGRPDYGWTTLNNIHVSRCTDGWFINLPNPDPLT